MSKNLNIEDQGYIKLTARTTVLPQDTGCVDVIITGDYQHP